MPSIVQQHALIRYGLGDPAFNGANTGSSPCEGANSRHAIWMIPALQALQMCGVFDLDLFRPSVVLR